MNAGFTNTEFTNTEFTNTEFTHTETVSPELSLRLMFEKPNREQARYQRLIQHL